MNEEEIKKVALQAVEKKNNWIKNLNTYFTGPFLIYLSMKKSLSPLEKKILTVLGIGTITYNWDNYKKQLQR